MVVLPAAEALRLAPPPPLIYATVDALYEVPAKVHELEAVSGLSLCLLQATNKSVTDA